MTLLIGLIITATGLFCQWYGIAPKASLLLMAVGGAIIQNYGR